MPKGIYLRKPFTEEHIANLSISHRGKHPSEETRQRLRIVHTGKHHSEETLEKMRKPRGPMSEEAKYNLSVSGKKFHQEHPEAGVKTGVSSRQRWADPAYYDSLSGENASNWQGGIGNLPYHSNFTKEFRAYIRQRDEVCQFCGRTEKEEGTKLSVHHINYDKMNDCSNEYDFITLCRGCNIKVESKRDLYRDYFTFRLTYGIMLV